MQGNVFTPKLHDIVIPSKSECFEELFLVMEFVSGDLRGLLSNPKYQLEEDHATVVLYNILCAMNFLHSANVMHRDLKPANILIN
mgnify:CR=1 FL=1